MRPVRQSIIKAMQAGSQVRHSDQQAIIQAGRSAFRPGRKSGQTHRQAFGLGKKANI